MPLPAVSAAATVHAPKTFEALVTAKSAVIVASTVGITPAAPLVAGK